MAYKFSDFESIGLQLLQFTGKISSDDVTNALRYDLHRTDRPASAKIIFDVGDAVLDFSYESMNRFVDNRKIDPGRTKLGHMAIVVSNSRNFGIARMYQMISEGAGLWEECRVFNTMDEARAWPNIPADANLSL